MLLAKLAVPSNAVLKRCAASGATSAMICTIARPSSEGSSPLEVAQSDSSCSSTLGGISPASSSSLAPSRQSKLSESTPTVTPLPLTPNRSRASAACNAATPWLTTGACCCGRRRRGLAAVPASGGRASPPPRTFASEGRAKRSSAIRAAAASASTGSHPLTTGAAVAPRRNPSASSRARNPDASADATASMRTCPLRTGKSVCEASKAAPCADAAPPCRAWWYNRASFAPIFAIGPSLPSRSGP